MANPGYVRSTDGNNADDGSTWALANLDLVGAMADAVAGDRIWVSDAHAESTASSITITSPGTVASPCQILCGDDAAEPPTSLTTTATVDTTGNSSITVNGCAYVYGITFRPGITTGGGASSLSLSTGVNDVVQEYEQCVFYLATNNSSPKISLGGDSNGPRLMTWRNCNIRFSNAGQAINVGGGALFEWRGGAVVSGSTSPTTLITFTGTRGANAIISGVDFSNFGTTFSVVGAASHNTGTVALRNCKLPTSWAGTLLASAPSPGQRVEMLNCSSTDTNYNLWVEDYAGSIRQETTIVKDNGASDGTTNLSWKMASSADAEYPHQALVSPQIQRWNETVGSSVTVTVDFIHDSVTNLQDDEVWLAVEYLGTSGTPLALFVNDAAATVIATPADQTASSATWTTTGLTNPNEQQLSVSFTPQEKGLIIARVHLAVASKTVYVDPVLQVS